MLKFNEKRVAASLNVADTTYAPAETYQHAIQAVLSHPTLAQPSELIYLSNQEFFERFPDPAIYSQGMPYYFTDYGGDLYFDRPLDKAYTLGLRYTEASSRLTDATNSTPQIPQEFDGIYIHAGLAGIEAYRENFDLEAIHLRRVEDITEDLLGRYSLRVKRPGKARTIRRRGDDGW